MDPRALTTRQVLIGVAVGVLGVALAALSSESVAEALNIGTSGLILALLVVWLAKPARYGAMPLALRAGVISGSLLWLAWVLSTFVPFPPAVEFAFGVLGYGALVAAILALALAYRVSRRQIGQEPPTRGGSDSGH